MMFGVSLTNPGRDARVKLPKHVREEPNPPSAEHVLAAAAGASERQLGDQSAAAAASRPRRFGASSSTVRRSRSRSGVRLRGRTELTAGSSAASFRVRFGSAPHGIALGNSVLERIAGIADKHRQ